MASAPAILVDFAPAPAAPALTPTALPPGPPQPQQQAQPQPKPEQKPEPKRTLAKVEAEAPPDKPVTQKTDTPPKLAPLALLDVPLEPTAPDTIDVLPPRKPVEARHKSKPRQRQASRASAPSTAARRATRAAAVAPGASTHHSNALPNWQSALVARIERHKHYPEAALARGERGVAQVAFSVDRSGRLHDARIVRSSGSSAARPRRAGLAAPLAAAAAAAAGTARRAHPGRGAAALRYSLNRFGKASRRLRATKVVA